MLSVLFTWDCWVVQNQMESEAASLQPRSIKWEGGPGQLLHAKHPCVEAAHDITSQLYRAQRMVLPSKVACKNPKMLGIYFLLLQDCLSCACDEEDNSFMTAAACLTLTLLS